MCGARFIFCINLDILSQRGDFMSNKPMGRQSFLFEIPPVITSWASVSGKKEKEGPLSRYFDVVCRDSYFGQKTWEQAEKKMQQMALDTLAQKCGMEKERFQLVLSGDLLNQCIGSSFSLRNSGIPHLGLYGACSTMGEALSLGAMTVDAGHADCVLAMASSHYATAEKQFRFPLAYGNQRPQSATWTVTGCGAVVLSSGGHVLKKNGRVIRIAGITTGKMVDLDFKDSMNMGAAMAPAAWDTIVQNFEDLGVDQDWYDQIITGDLGKIGQKILLELLKQKGYDLADKHMDCGLKIYDGENQDTHSGGSGCGCAAVTLCSHILPKLLDGTWRRILFLPTGALLSTVSYNEGQSIPGIAHGVILESCAASSLESGAASERKR